MRRKTLASLWFLVMLLLSGPLFSQQALFVTNSDPGNYNASDQAILARLQGLGLTVTGVGGPSNPATAADANGKDLIIISASVLSTNIGGMYTHTPVPMIVCESYLFDDLHMTGHITGVDYGVQGSVDRVQITDPSHPLAAGFNGNVTVTTAQTTLRWGDPSNNADKVARLFNHPNQYAIFSYDAGDMMVGLAAPATRIGFFFDTNTASHPTHNAWSFFDDAVHYALSSNCTAQTEVLKTPTNHITLGAGGTQTITANIQTPGVIPNGYSVLYLLTTGSNQVIQQTATTPSFSVSAAGTYSFHSLVYDSDPNSPDYFDISTINTGSTTLLNILIQITTGGICASIDLAGDDITVNNCTADAGTLTIDQDPVNILNGSATVSATPDGNIHVPAGYSQIYVLTSGPNLVIEQVSASPNFTVNAPGDYTIHTLVYDADPNSPNFLDLSVVQFGTTTGGDVLALVLANQICASLDVAGAGVHVQGCTADAGTLTIDQNPVILANGAATISATPDGNIVVPTGYSQIFVLTSGTGLVIEQVSATPSFTVNAAGAYTIHTLVYDADPNSANFLDLSIVQFGTTTGVDVLNLVTANGLCASLDVAGAPVHVNDCTADAGTLTIDQNPVVLANGAATISATPDGNIVVPTGYSQIFVLTSGTGLVIEQVSATPSFTVNAAGAYTIHTLVYDADPNSANFLDLSIVQFGTTTGVDVLNLVAANGLCASLDVAGAPVHVNDCTADAGTLTIDQNPVVLANGAATISATPDGNIVVPTGYSQIFVLTSGTGLVIEQVSATPSFTVNAAGAYTIHTLVYDADPNSANFLDLSIVQFGTTTGVDVLNLVTANGLCASLDVAGAPVHVNDCTADAGTLTIDQNPVVLANGVATISATPDGNIVVPVGYSQIFVLTSGTGLVIEQVSATPSFTVNAAGAYTIHTLVYDADPNSANFLDLSIVQFGTTTGVDVLNLVTANGLCASLDVAGAPVHVNDCTADAGTLTIDQNPVVLANGAATISATPDGNIVVPTGYSQIFVLTSGTGLVIEQVSATPSFTVNAAGAYTIHTLVYDADPNSANFLDLSIVQLGTTTGVDVLNLVTANGLCASLDVAGAPVHVNDCTADAGTLTIDQNPVVLANGAATISATPDGNIVVPTGYSQIFVLTSGTGLVIEQVSATPSFTVNAAGSYTIHTLVYDADPNSANFLDLSIVQFGTTTGVDVLNLVTANGLCASLDVAGAPVHVNNCTADAGTLTIDQNPVVLANGAATISATPDGNIVVPTGYSQIFVLTSGTGLVIEQVSATPSFTVNTAGAYTIHTLVYDADPNSANFLDLSIVQFGTTTGVDVLNLVTANGLCASLDVAGAPVHVNDCTADAGTLTIDQNPVVLANGAATISATPDGNIVVPTGYSQIFVLTSGTGLVIEQVSATPSFTVNAAGAYTIHTLVYDADPNSANFLDLSIVQFGTTTGVDVLNLVTANGLCASLDVAGAPVHVNDCTADAGTLTIDQNPVVLANGAATISATPDGNIVVPTGYSQIFVLTSGTGLVIEQVSATPSFTVNAAGSYTIHTLVYDADPNSANFLDLSIVQFGTTTGVDVLNLVTANGLCASLDVAGAPVHVNDCTADAGTLTIDQNPVVLANGAATISATPDGNIVVPTGYSQIFVLTSGTGLVIEQVSATPSFTVNAAGAYTIHTLVYDADPNSANFLDLSIVQFGTTTGVDVLNLVTANGLCASLDVAGAPVHVNDCTADAGTLTIDQNPVVLANGAATISATPDGNIVVPTGYSQIFVLTSGTGLVIEQVSATPSFTVNTAGSYTIHTLVYDADPNSANFLDLSIVQFGTTTGVDVLNLVTANGLCASLDVAGAPVHVNDCTADAGTLTIDQNPVVLANGAATISATPDGNIVVPNGYSQIFVLTSGPNLVIEQVSATPSFTVNVAGAYTIHTLVYDADPNSANFLDLSIVQFGTTTGVDVLNLVTANGLCASLDVAGAPVHVNDCTADAGTLTIDQNPVVLANGAATISATPDGNIVVPTGYSQIFVLTSGTGLVIEQVSATPSFTVNAAGSYTIHTLVYDADPNSANFLDLSIVQFGTTTGVDVLNLVTANGLCASLDVAGAPVHVNDCTADAGTLTIDQDPVFTSGGSATVSATPDGNAVVPTGYSQIYVLTSGSNLVIEQVSATPSFTVNMTGDYTIHTLVYDGDPNSPNFLDLAVVQFGVTTGVDVLNIVINNGLCASLDVAGAGVHVQDCVADAGSLTIDQDPVILANGSATVSATPDGNINVPAGYSVIYVLTEGPNLVIEQVSATPSFTVNTSADYTIHTLVYDADPNSGNFLDLSVVQFGVTTGVDVLTLVAANGLCASLDVAGAGVHVQNCTADAGTITIDHNPVHLTNGSATVSATPDGNIVIPTGYSVIYVLTEGPNLVIEQVSTTPSFVVSDTGSFTIHTLVYDGNPNSPNFLDLSVVQFGTTTGVDVLNLVTANGLCASLDVAGAPVHVVDLNGLLDFTATQNAWDVTLDWSVGNTVMGQSYKLGRSLDGVTYQVIHNVEEAETGVVSKDYQYVDTNPYNGQNYYKITHYDENGIFISELKLDIYFTPSTKPTLSVFPNPAIDILNLTRVDNLDDPTQVIITNLNGQKVMEVNSLLYGGESTTINVSTLPAGLYQVVMYDAQGNRISATKLQVN